MGHVPSLARTKTQRLNDLAREQHGIVCRRQALALGYSDSAIGRCIEAGLWQRCHAGVYQVAPSRQRFEAEVMALVLRAPGRAWASHRAAAWIWKLTEIGPPVAEISTTANLRGRRERIHVVEHVPDADRRAVDGMPVTCVERTSVDLAGVVGERKLEAAVVEALRTKSTTVAALRERVQAGTPRAGSRRLRALLDGWDSLSCSESVLEARLRKLLHRAGIPPGVPQHKIVDSNRIVARVDLAYPKQRVAIEADGYAGTATGRGGKPTSLDGTR